MSRPSGTDGSWAMVLEEPGPAGPGRLVRQDRPIPEPDPGHVLLKVHACGVCRTDLHTVEGDLQLPRLPVVPGHQIVGTVLARGPGAERFQEGARVGVPWLGWSCGECDFCRSGLENLCPKAEFTGLHRDGGYATHVVAHEAFVYPIPEGYGDLEAAPLLCGGIIGYRALRLTGVPIGGRIGMFGFGGSAHVTLQVARHLGMEVYVFSRGASHRQLAERLGAAWTGGLDERPDVALDGAIVFAPAGPVVPRALSVVRPGGTVSLAGITMTPIPEMNYDSLLYHERTLRSVANFTRRDARELLVIAKAGGIRTQVVPYPLDQANEALVALKEGRIDGMAVLVVQER